MEYDIIEKDFGFIDKSWKGFIKPYDGDIYIPTYIGDGGSAI